MFIKVREISILVLGLEDTTNKSSWFGSFVCKRMSCFSASKESIASVSSVYIQIKRCSWILKFASLLNFK